MKRLIVLLVVCGAAALGGCAISPPDSIPAGRVCNFQRWPISIAIPSEGDTPGKTGGRADPELVQNVGQALQDEHPGEAGQHSMLFLSGGSLNGSFGAGFLHGWAQSRGGDLPPFDVVTGISTGSIIATFAFIGDDEVPMEAYQITRESELLRPNVQRGNHLSYARVLRRGALADLLPLRNQLFRRIDRSVLERVARRSLPAEQGGSRALLLVGVVDADTGQAEALDLTHMARRYVDAGRSASADTARNAEGETADQVVARNCYADAILASSSAPLAAPPVFIDHRMYVDGGVRFGMFSEDVVAGIPDVQKRPGSRTRLYVIANGDLEVSPRCGETTGSSCTTGTTDADRRHRPWTLPDLALRSENMLVNQVYRFSANHIIGRNKDNPVYFARIGAGAQDFRTRIDVAGLEPAGEMTCQEWHKVDETTQHPIQFFPRYMRCLVAYGIERGRRQRWDYPPRPDEVVPVAKPTATDAAAARDARPPVPTFRPEP